MYKLFKYTIFYSALSYSSLCFSGGPLILEGPSGNTPVTYQNPTITVQIENGDLGDPDINGRLNADADLLVQDAFNLWNNVNTSTVDLIIDPTPHDIADIDIDISNFVDFIPKFNGDTSNSDDELNPVVYDSDGKIIDAFFGGPDANGNLPSDNIIGFAASIYTLGGSYFDEGYAVINGKITLSDTELTLLIAHEIGHFFGLDHTQVNINPQETSPDIPRFCETTSRQDYPLMYPFVCRDTTSLHSDDISALSALYPATNINDNFGILQGRFVDESGSALLGANIWAENIATGETYSIVSDYLKQGTGFYRLYLPAGNYTLHANSINPEFNDGSSIGPYAKELTDASFISPHPIEEVIYQGETDSGVEVITMSVNQTMEINFSSTGQFVVLPELLPEADTTSGSGGTTSHITLLFLLSLLLSGRCLAERKPESMPVS
jgi:hypothetical protein